MRLPSLLYPSNPSSYLPSGHGRRWRWAHWVCLQWGLALGLGATNFSGVTRNQWTMSFNRFSISPSTMASIFLTQQTRMEPAGWMARVKSYSESSSGSFKVCSYFQFNEYMVYDKMAHRDDWWSGQRRVLKDIVIATKFAAYPWRLTPGQFVNACKYIYFSHCTLILCSIRNEVRIDYVWILQCLARSDADWTNWNRAITLVNCKLCSFSGASSLGWFSCNVW